MDLSKEDSLSAKNNPPHRRCGGFFLRRKTAENPNRFDKMRSVLDAAGGPQDLLSSFSLLMITKRACILDAKGGPKD